MSLRIDIKGNWNRLTRFLKGVSDVDPTPILEYYGQAGVDALADATPVDTGLTARSWYYEITKLDGGWELSWNNSNIQNGIPIAVLIQMGHATKSGGWVQGYDYINPALEDVFKKFSIAIGKEYGK